MYRNQKEANFFSSSSSTVTNLRCRATKASFETSVFARDSHDSHRINSVASCLLQIIMAILVTNSSLNPFNFRS